MVGSRSMEMFSAQHQIVSYSLLLSELDIKFVQLFLLSFASQLSGIFTLNEDLFLSTAIFVYAATSPVNGYFGGGLYSRMGGKLWIRQMLIAAFLVPTMVCTTAFFINFIAMGYHASRAIPFGTMVAVASICIFVILPLTLVGTVLGRNMAGTPDYPCRVNAVPRPVPRPIPEKKWFMEPLVIVMLGGILPFGSIFIEMYFIFTSFWAYKIYYVYGFMLLVFIILAIVTVCVTIVYAHTSSLTQRIIDGNGQAFCRLALLLDTSTCIPSTTSFSRRKCTDCFRRLFILDTWLYFPVLLG